ncbi:MAG: hypothetical protein NTV21_11575 [Planctomycetota bacterium]|nr:hypothetical protein [Planctomycetota bacterium]
MIDLPFSLNSEPVKYVVIALSAPVWMPFARALWKELNDSLRPEGGILGLAPSEKELEALNKAEGLHDTPLISETWEEHEGGTGPRQAARRTRSSGASAPAATPRPRGFR